MIQKYKSNH